MEPLPAALKAASRITWGSDQAAHRFHRLAFKATRKPKPSVAPWNSNFPSQQKCRYSSHAKLLALGFSSASRRHMHCCPSDSVRGFSSRSERIGKDVISQIKREEERGDLHQAKEELLASLESLRTSADGGSVYLLQSRLSRALPESSAAASMAADVGKLVSELKALKQEKAELMAFRHQTPREIRREYTQMMLIGLATGLAAAIHPIFFAGTIYGVVRIRKARLAEADRDAGTGRLEEVMRLLKQNKTDLNVLLDKLTLLVKEGQAKHLMNQQK